MKYNEYLEQRQALMNELQGLIDTGASDEEYTAKKSEIEALDEKWAAICQRQADLNALSDSQSTVNVQALAGVNMDNAAPVAAVSMAPVAAQANDPESMVSSDAYVNAWAKVMMGQKLSADEQNLVQMVNAYTHTTENTGIVIPETVAAGIWDMVEDLYPLWADVQKTYVKGNYTVPISSASAEAAWYDEGTATADGTETFRSLTLTGCELARSVTVSWKLREMAIADFIPFIQRKLAQKMGAALSYGVAKGKGQPGSGDTFKPEPKGIITELEAETSTPQVVEYTASALSYTNLTAARAKVTVGKNQLAFYANAETIWTELANVKDQNQRPIMVADPVNGGVSRIFGIPVKEDDSLAAGEIILGAPSVGYIANVNKDMSIVTEEHAKARTVDYCSYAIVDGGVLSTKAFALLKRATANAVAEGEGGNG